MLWRAARVASVPTMPRPHNVSTPPRAGVSWVMRVRPSTGTVVVVAVDGALGGAVVVVVGGSVVGATVVSVLVVSRLSALAGFVFTAGWALVAVAVATYADAVRWVTLLALVVLVGVLVARTARSADKSRILLG